MKDTTSTPRAACHSLSDTDDMCLKLKKPVTATTATTDTTAKNIKRILYIIIPLTLPEIQKLVPIAPKQEKNLNLRFQKRNGEKGRKARSKGCLIKSSKER